MAGHAGIVRRGRLIPVVALAVCVAWSSDAAAAVVTCGQVVTQSITVSNDVTGCSGSGIVVGADGIVIDLVGHQVVHDGSPPDDADTGIDFAGHHGATVRNGRVRDFGRQVRLSGSDNVAFRLTLAAGVPRNGVDVTGSGNALRSSTLDRVGIIARGASDTVIDGVRVINADLQLDGVGDHGNAVVNSRFTGGSIAVGFATGDTITGNVVDLSGLPSGASREGILVVASEDTTVQRNEVRGATDGIAVDSSGDEPGPGSTGVSVIGNRVFDSEIGVRLTFNRAGFPDVVRANTLQRNGTGIDVRGGRDVVIADNVVGSPRSQSGGVGGNGVGIKVGGQNERTSVLRNQVNHNTGDGIAVDDEQDELDPEDTRLEGNVANLNGGNGLLVTDVSATLIRNEARGNGLWGILAPPSVTDGGRNRASGNGAGQCSPGLVCGP